MPFAENAVEDPVDCPGLGGVIAMLVNARQVTVVEAVNDPLVAVITLVPADKQLTTCCVPTDPNIATPGFPVLQAAD